MYQQKGGSHLGKHGTLVALPVMWHSSGYIILEYHRTQTLKINETVLGTVVVHCSGVITEDVEARSGFSPFFHVFALFSIYIPGTFYKTSKRDFGRPRFFSVFAPFLCCQKLKIFCAYLVAALLPR